MKKYVTNLSIIITLLCLLLCHKLLATDYATKMTFSQDTIAYLDIPARSQDAVTGSKFANQIAGLSIKKRETAIVNQILSGNLPSFSRKLNPVTMNFDNYKITFYTVNDYMAIGSDEDYIYIPMMPATAQHLANRLNCSLPTKKIVDTIYSQANVKLEPQPIAWSEKNTTVPVFMDHTNTISQQFQEKDLNRPADSIIAGHKKDIIISNKIYSQDRNYDRVVIYGWHRSQNDPIQPVYNGHSALYADYSHGVRFISNFTYINGEKDSIQHVLQASNLAFLLSSEGVISKPYYPVSDWFVSIKNRSNYFPESFQLNHNYPNPFNPKTTIKYSLPKASQVKISIYNLNGKLIETILNDRKSAGSHYTKWDASDFASGVYFYKIQAGNFTDVKRCILMK